MALKNNINTYDDMAAYNADSTKEYPNVSYIIATDEVVWAKDDPADLRRVICTYNVTSTSSATKLLGSKTSISKQIIDGVEQSSVVTEYTFDTTGEHLVKYEFKNNQIGISAFQNCSNLTSINIPNSVTSIGTAAFQSCSGLTSVTIPSSVTRIGDHTFQGCSSLTSITIPNSVTSIGSYAFEYCTNLTSITVEATTPPTLEYLYGRYSQFSNNASGRKIYVPAESVAAYKSASGWSTYASDIEAIA